MRKPIRRQWRALRISMRNWAWWSIYSPIRPAHWRAMLWCSKSVRWRVLCTNQQLHPRTRRLCRQVLQLTCNFIVKKYYNNKILNHRIYSAITTPRPLSKNSSHYSPFATQSYRKNSKTVLLSITPPVPMSAPLSRVRACSATSSNHAHHNM